MTDADPERIRSAVVTLDKLSEEVTGDDQRVINGAIEICMEHLEEGESDG